MRLARVVLAVAMLMAGCFPIELDVSREGKILIPRQEGFFVLDVTTGKMEKVYALAGGNPTFARYSPSGKEIVAVTESDGKMMGKSHVLTLVTLSTGKGRVLYSGSNATYTRWSPDGQYLSLSRVAEQKTPPLEENLPETYLISIKGGDAKHLASNTSALHRWFPDSKALLIFQIEKKVKNVYHGTITALDIPSGKGKPLASVLGSQNVFFDLSPDGTTVLFTAKAAGPPGATLQAGKDRLFELDIAKRSIRTVKEKAEYAIWSPSGNQVLLGTNEKDGILTLQVADRGFTQFRKIGSDAASKVSEGIGVQTRIYPGWLGEGTVFYFAKTAVYGTAGKNLELVMVSTDGKNRWRYQAAIDDAATRVGK
ncbi:MAG: TolB family protein [Candidatus Methylomirabilales bacterium]